MKYAIACMNEEVFQHFGKCPSFYLVDIEAGIVQHKDLLETTDRGHNALVQILKTAKVETLVCGGIGEGARNELAKVSINLISGAEGHIDIIINKLCKNVLVDSPKGKCTHHHGDAKHTCESNS